MTPLVHRLRASFGRRSRVDPRLWVFGALLLAIGTVLWIGYDAGLPAYETPNLPWWAYAVAFFLAARTRGHGQPTAGDASDHDGSCSLRGRALSCDPFRSPARLRCGDGPVGGAPEAVWSLADGVRARPFRGLRFGRHLGVPAPRGEPEPSGLAQRAGCHSGDWHHRAAARALRGGAAPPPRSQRLDRGRLPPGVRVRRCRHVHVHRADCGPPHPGRPARARSADGRHHRGAHDPSGMGARALRP